MKFGLLDVQVREVWSVVVINVVLGVLVLRVWDVWLGDVIKVVACMGIGFLMVVGQGGNRTSGNMSTLSKENGVILSVWSAAMGAVGATTELPCLGALPVD